MLRILYGNLYFFGRSAKRVSKVPDIFWLQFNLSEPLSLVPILLLGPAALKDSGAPQMVDPEEKKRFLCTNLDGHTDGEVDIYVTRELLLANASEP